MIFQSFMPLLNFSTVEKKVIARKICKRKCFSGRFCGLQILRNPHCRSDICMRKNHWKKVASRVLSIPLLGRWSIPGHGETACWIGWRKSDPRKKYGRYSSDRKCFPRLWDKSGRISVGWRQWDMRWKFSRIPLCRQRILFG